jgi:serine/threonine-protein kinase
VVGPDAEPPRPRVRLRDPDATTPSGDSRLPAAETPPPVHLGGRYELHGEIARGGMGIVLRGRDTDLGRDVAVKVLLEAHQGHPELVRRFVEEAQVAGQLQHPGIAPVYELGQCPDERPYFAMKLVKGQTLEELLAGRTDPAQQRPRWLKIFEQVCQTMAYAHARGVIHRDLKPSNVMVGAFGEVQVMDWGLAKILGGDNGSADRPRPGSRSVIRTLRGTGDATPDGAGKPTEAGRVLGTPSYMAPEQALGDVDLLDARCDVFGLGAVLCELLTGEPPYVGDDSTAVLRRAMRADLTGAFARLDDCGADAELIALAKHCLAPEPGDRPPDAGAVLGKMTSYLQSVEERLRQAEVGRAAEQARAEEARATAVHERRARRLTLLVMALLTALAGSGLLAYWWYKANWLAQQQAESDLIEHTFKAESERQHYTVPLRDRGWALALLDGSANWAGHVAAARAELDQAETLAARLKGGPRPAVATALKTLREALAHDEADHALAVQLDTIRLESASMVAGRWDESVAAAQYEAAFRKLGLAVADAAPDELAKQLQALPLRWLLVAALDHWVDVVRDAALRDRLLELARRADPDPWRDRFHDPRVWGNRPALEALAAEPGAADQTPALVVALARRLQASGGDALPLLRAARLRWPADFWLGFQAGVAATDPAEREGGFRAALAVRPQSVAAYNNLGAALLDRGDKAGAVAAYQKAVALEPGAVAAHNGLGLVLKTQGNLAAAVAEFQKALALNPNYTMAHYNLGLVRRQQGDVAGAIAAYRQALALDPKFGAAHNSLGTALRAQGDVNGALAAYREALALQPKNAQAHNNLGNALLDKGDLEGAVAAHRRALELEPKNARMHSNLGAVLYKQGRYADSARAFGQAEALHTEARSPLAAQAEFDRRRSERMAEAQGRLAAYLRGEFVPQSVAERLTLAAVCRPEGRYVLAAQLSAEAFALDPKAAEDMRAGYRFLAARAAARAASGDGVGADALDAAARARWRRQALEWLRADLAVWSRMADGGKPADRRAVADALRQWQQEKDLAALRDPDALASLPADEQAAWRQLWADVARVLRGTRAEGAR